ncbi:DUF862 [Geosmithia morbida]|uniref:DUF862 n=1 Tax=Geosmithia morbida TaxID=1094350 RepID=A0A9P4YT58_9HYPO|nr:DUF862 [Geosmithia morbida]KAF4122325.1 DUF862 [Geosmithia morbida]
MSGRTSGSSRHPGRGHRSTLSLQKTEILINVYDLLPAGRVSSVLWSIGASLLHSGVVINGKEYAFGGHDQPGLTGVYWTKPKTEPPGGTFRCELLHGFTLASDQEIDAVVRSVSDEFTGTSYNLLTKNCNHFTSHLVEKLTNTPGPGWLNRAAAFGVAFPCIVPREWIEPPDYETIDGGALLSPDTDVFGDENARMLRSSDETPRLVGSESSTMSEMGFEQGWDRDDDATPRPSGHHRTVSRDSSGRILPVAERAPVR